MYRRFLAWSENEVPYNDFVILKYLSTADTSHDRLLECANVARGILHCSKRHSRSDFKTCWSATGPYFDGCGAREPVRRVGECPTCSGSGRMQTCHRRGRFIIPDGDFFAKRPGHRERFEFIGTAGGNYMSEPLRIVHGPFGRVALLLLDKSMVLHAHRVSHVIFKEGGPDIQFGVRNREYVLSDKNVLLG